MAIGAVNTTLKKAVVVCLLSIGVAACKTTEPLYYYGEYPSTVYNFFKADDTSISEQIDVLEETLEKASNNGKAVPPGLHAHLGMLYFEVGDEATAIGHLSTEKALFPESTQFIDFLLTNRQGEGK
jgi:hypothetical protein